MIQAPLSQKAVARQQRGLTQQQRKYQIAKLMFDYAFVVPALIFLAPLMLLIAILIKLDSPGPVFYRRRTLGQFGREIQTLNFRTMFVDGDQRLIQNRAQWVQLLREGRCTVDPRVTRVGRFLRTTGLDQLPRLINILRRDMTLVGPRTLTRKDMIQLGRDQVELITSVMPGLTGLSQVQTHLDDAPADRLTLDIRYAQTPSLRGDLRILVNTFKAVVGR